MAEPAKFTFNTVFGQVRQPEEDVPPAPSFSEEELAEAREAAFAEGLTQGRSETLAAAEQRIADSLEKLLEKSADLDMVQKGELERIRGEAASLAHEIAGKLAPAMTARMPLAEVKVLLDECLSHLNETPHIVIRIAEAHADALRERADSLATERGFSGKIMIMGEADMAPGDCRIEWADGGIERNTAALSDKISRAIRRHVDAMMNGGETGAALHAPVPGQLNSEGVAL